jgi:drug/metabolite transporter (DMT)-like permease
MKPRVRITFALTALAMVAFAANSIFCRMALGSGTIDAASFATIRLGSGALTLWLIVVASRPGARSVHGDWRATMALLVYAVFFSFAYISLSTGTGALILFGSVQFVMFVAGLRAGEQSPRIAWAGFLLAVGGMVYLVSPGITAPPPVGAALMATAGAAWGFYSLLGRGVADPLKSTAGNFIYSVPVSVLVSLLFASEFHATRDGVLLALASGALASGVGYAIWYTALRGLTATTAASVQLSPMVLAALGGAVFMGEPVTVRLVLASLAVLGGIAMIILRDRLRVGERL